MTNSRDIAEAMDLATLLSDQILVIGGQRGPRSSDLRRAVARFQANLETGYRQETLGPTIAALFDSALAAGVTAVSFRSVREVATGSAAVGGLALWTRLSFERQALVAEARRWATVVFVNRDDAETARLSLTLAFDAVIEAASETGDYAVMRAFTALFGAIQRHLSSTALPLPRVVSYELPATLPSLVLAHRLYGDASRRSEIEQQNRVVHPLFMPRSGKALAQ